jgi:hypothetical protein
MVTAVFEGRFAAAYDSVRKALAEYRPFAFESELTQCLELLRALTPLVGDAGAQRRYMTELADTYCELALLDGSGGRALALYARW